MMIEVFRELYKVTARFGFQSELMHLARSQKKYGMITNVIRNKIDLMFTRSAGQDKDEVEVVSVKALDHVGATQQCMEIPYPEGSGAIVFVWRGADRPYGNVLHEGDKRECGSQYNAWKVYPNLRDQFTANSLQFDISYRDSNLNDHVMKTFSTSRFQLSTPLAALTILLMLIAVSAKAQPITTPRTASPAAMVQQTIGISTVTVSYSRPAVKGREIWGALVPYGWNVQPFGAQKEAPWRAGANENTVITFSHPVKVEGTKVPAGSYGLFFTINQDNSGEVVLSKDYKSWGSFWYEPANDQLRAKIRLRTIPDTELLTYDFINLAKNTGELVLNWEKKQFPVQLEFAVDEIVMANAEDELKGPIGFTPQGFTSAANYALQNNINQEKAMRWIDQAMAVNSTFATKRIKAGLLKQAGKNDEGEKLMKEAMSTATEIELNNYGYQLLGQGENDKAIEVFLLNTERNPRSANAWDSLGEGYATKGDKANAIKSFKKSLSLNPPANVKANSEKFLKQFGQL